MKKTKSILCFIILLGIVTIGSSFKKAKITKQEYSDTIKYDYAVMTVWLDFAESSMIIEYSDGKNSEDFVKLKKIKNNDLKSNVNGYVMYAFKYLNKQNYELQSSSMVTLKPGSFFNGAFYKEYIFCRKVSQ